MEISGLSETKSNQCAVDSGVEARRVTSVPTLPRANAHALRMGYVETARVETLFKASPSSFLGIVRHDRIPSESRGLGACPMVSLDLPQFNGSPLAEVWMSSLPVTFHQTGGIHCAMNDEVLFGALQLDERSGTQLDTLTYHAYRRLLVQARALGYPYLLRVWNYFPHINRESDGLERYQRFCAGRYQALAECLSEFLQRRLVWASGLIDVANVDELLLVCRRVTH